jgi:hypothetical protein
VAVKRRQRLARQPDHALVKARIHQPLEKPRGGRADAGVVYWQRDDGSFRRRRVVVLRVPASQMAGEAAQYGEGSHTSL